MNSYLLIHNHISQIVEAPSPGLAAVIHGPGDKWHARKGAAPGHYIVYEFDFDGRYHGHVLDIVDLGNGQQGPSEGDVPPIHDGGKHNA